MVASSEFEGRSGYLRWAPKVLIAIAIAVLAIHWPRSREWAGLSLLLAYIHARWLAWRFVVSDEGVLLIFPFGRRMLIPRDSVSVRVDLVGAVLKVRGRLLRYLLFDGVLYRPGREDSLRSAFVEHGFRLAD